MTPLPIAALPKVCQIYHAHPIWRLNLDLNQDIAPLNLDHDHDLDIDLGIQIFR